MSNTLNAYRIHIYTKRGNKSEYWVRAINAYSAKDAIAMIEAEYDWYVKSDQFQQYAIYKMFCGVALEMENDAANEDEGSSENKEDLKNHKTSAIIH